MKNILLFLLFLLIAEFYVIGQVMDVIGILTTLFILVVTAMLGGKLVIRVGKVTLRSIAKKMQQGTSNGLDVAEGGFFLIAGLLFIFPGFISDILALLLLIPPIRRLAAFFLIRLFFGAQLRSHFTAANTIIDGEAIREAEPPHSSPLHLPPPKDNCT